METWEEEVGERRVGRTSREGKEGRRRKRESKTWSAQTAPYNDFFRGLLTYMDGALTLKFTLCHEKGVDGSE